MNKSSEGRNPEEKSVPKWSSPPPRRHGGEREQGRGRRALAAHVEALSQRLVRQRFERPFSCRARGRARGQENGERGGGGTGTAGPRATKSRSHPRRAFSPGPNNAAVFARHVARVWIGSVAKQGRGILRRTFASEARARRRWRRRFASLRRVFTIFLGRIGAVLMKLLFQRSWLEAQMGKWKKNSGNSRFGYRGENVEKRLHCGITGLESVQSFQREGSTSTINMPSTTAGEK